MKIETYRCDVCERECIDVVGVEPVGFVELREISIGMANKHICKHCLIFLAKMARQREAKTVTS